MKKKVEDKGAILLLVVVISLILTMVGATYIYITQVEGIAVKKVEARMRAFFLAEAGLEAARAWIVDCSTTTIENMYTTAVFDPFGGNQTIPGSPPGSFYRVQIDPADTNDDGSVVNRTYVVTSTGVCPYGLGGTVNITRVLEETLLAAGFLSNYAYFSYEEYQGGVTTAGRGNQDPPCLRYYFTNYDRFFNGPVHSNDVISLFGVNGGHLIADGDDEVFWISGGRWDVTTARDIFFYRLSAPTGGSYTLDPPIDPYYTTDEEPFFVRTANFPPPQEYHRVQPIHMYRNSTQSMARLQAAANDTIGTGVGGTDVTIGATDVNTIPIPAGNAGGGVYFVNGDIPRLECTNLQNWVTIVANGDITITDDITTNGGMLGIVAGGNIIIEFDDPGTGPNWPNDFQIDAFLLAYGSFYAARWNAPWHIGTITVTGGIIQHTRLPWGTRPLDYPPANVQRGYHLTVNYDTRAIDEPPPHFPKYNTVETALWQEN